MKKFIHSSNKRRIPSISLLQRGKQEIAEEAKRRSFLNIAL